MAKKFEKLYQSDVVLLQKDTEGNPKEGIVVELQDNGNGTRSLVIQQTYWNTEINDWSYCSPRAGGGKACAIRQKLVGIKVLPWLREELEKLEAAEVKIRNTATTTTKTTKVNAVVNPALDFSDDAPTSATKTTKKAKAQAAATDDVVILENVSQRGHSRVR